MSSKIERVIDSIFSAVESNDMQTVSDLTTDDFKVWHSFDEITQTKAENLATMSALAVLGRPKYTVLQRFVLDNLIIQRHEFQMTSWDGNQKFRIQAGIFMTFRDDKLSAVHEYMDSRDIAEMGMAMQKVLERQAPARS